VRAAARERIEVHADSSKFHLFDPDSGQRI
jgi:hypothetical protein